MTVVSGDIYDDKFNVQNLLTLENPEVWGENYWLAPLYTKGTFILNLACRISFTSIQLVNTHNGVGKNCATRQFK